MGAWCALRAGGGVGAGVRGWLDRQHSREPRGCGCRRHRGLRGRAAVPQVHAQHRRQGLNRRGCGRRRHRGLRGRAAVPQVHAQHRCQGLNRRRRARRRARPTTLSLKPPYLNHVQSPSSDNSLRCVVVLCRITGPSGCRTHKIVSPSRGWRARISIHPCPGRMILLLPWGGGTGESAGQRLLSVARRRERMSSRGRRRTASADRVSPLLAWWRRGYSPAPSMTVDFDSRAQCDPRWSQQIPLTHPEHKTSEMPEYERDLTIRLLRKSA